MDEPALVRGPTGEIVNEIISPREFVEIQRVFQKLRGETLIEAIVQAGTLAELRSVGVREQKRLRKNRIFLLAS